MDSHAAAAMPMPSKASSGWEASRKLCLSLAGVWSLLGASACALLFVVSLIPLQGSSPYIRSVPAGLNDTGTAIGVGMVPLCLLIPIPLLIAGRRYLRRSLAGTGRIAAWTASASAGIVIEALFLFKLCHHDCLIPYRSWHVLELSVGYLVVGAAMAVVLLCPSASHAGGNVTVARLLDLVSAAALTQQPVVPKPDQYVCVKEIFKDFGEGTVLTQYWTPVDDKLSGLIETGNQAPTVATEERPGFYPGMRRAGLDD